MEQLTCAGCGDLLVEGDRFCGNCGTPAPAAQRPAPWPGTATGPSEGDTRQTRVASERADPPGPFFSHASSRPSGQLSNATRYLCAAAYLNLYFAKLVIWELIAMRRAVVPSIDFDLGPIIRHCLNARRIKLVRDIVLTAVVLLGFVISPLGTIMLLISAFLFGYLPSAWRRLRLFGRIMSLLVLVAAISIFYVLFFLNALVGLVSVIGVSALGGGSAAATATALFGFGFVIWYFFLLAVTAAVQFGYIRVRDRTLSERLRPGAEQIRFARSSDLVEARIAEVEAAQWGNVTLYAKENPFIGTGGRKGRVWSIAIQLHRARPARAVGPAGPDSSARQASRGYVPIDPVELHQVIRERLLRLKDPGLPPNERVFALTVDDHVVGEGRRRWDSPSIDLARRMTYSQASQEAIEALIRHPQAGLRYYQRVSVTDKSPPVMSGEREVIGAVDQGIAVSAFVHLAVEGRMFYLEFVQMVLPPIQRRYQVIDQMSSVWARGFLAQVTWGAVRSLLRDLIRAPAEIFGTLRLMRRERREYQALTASYSDQFSVDFGARTSVRELGSEKSLGTHIQELDAAKYTRIVERLLTETVLDFLAAKGVDTSAFERSASTIVNGNVISAGSISGGQFGGQGSIFNPAPEASQAQSAAG